MGDLNLEFIVPMKPEDIPLWKYQKYLELISREQAKKDENYLKAKLLRLFCDLEHDEVMRIDTLVVNAIVGHILGLLDIPDNTPLIQRFFMEIQGEKVEFGFIPNLEKMSFGEFIDLDKYIGDINNAHKAMAVLYRPIKKKWKDTYDILDYKGSDEYSEVLKDMPAVVAESAMVFFYRLGKKLPKYILDYSLNQLTGVQTQAQRQPSEQDGVGTYQFMLSHKEVHLKLMKQLGYPSIQR